MELDPEQRAKILQLLPPLLAEKDLTKTSLKEVRGELEQRMGLQPKALDAFRETVKELTTAEIRRQTDLNHNSASAPGSDGQPAAAEARDEPAEAAAPASPSPAPEKAAAKPAAKPVAKGKKRTSSPPAPAAAKARRESADEAGQSEKPRREVGGAKARQMNAMTRSEFMKAATTHDLVFAGQKIKLPPKMFSTGSVGFGASQKIKIDVGDCEGLQLQCSVNFIVVGSKEWKE